MMKFNLFFLYSKFIFFLILFFLKILIFINLYGIFNLSKIEDDFDEEYNKKLSINQFIYDIFNNNNILNDKEK